MPTDPVFPPREARRDSPAACAPAPVESSAAPRRAVAQAIHSVSGFLLRKVLATYLAVTLGIFAFEMALQAEEQRSGIVAELSMLQDTFVNSVGYALWHMDTNQLDTIVAGMLMMPSVSRVRIMLPHGDVLADRTSPAAAKHSSLLPETEFVDLRPVQSSESGENVGQLEIHSNSSVIVHRLKGAVVLAAVAAVVKTSVLVLLVNLYFERFLSRPLYGIARLAGAIDPKDPDVRPLPVKAGPPDELDVISAAINGLWSEVAATVGALDELNRNLESQVAQRTEMLQTANQALEASIDQLRQAQQSLVESEKMAALGGLVAGIAHEINTPVGLGLTGASHFEHMVRQLEARYRAGELDEARFERFLGDSRELARAIFVSLEKAAALVRSFKLVAVDQGSDDARTFDVRPYLDDVVLTHQPILRKARVAVTVECDPNLSISSYPGAWAQIISNLLNNAVTHAFPAARDDARVEITVAPHDDELTLTVRDNGVGMPESVARHAFEPFFTTNRHGGGSGLGLNIVYNLVSQRLRGRVQLHSVEGQGTTFEFHLPLLLKAAGPVADAITT